MRCRVQPYQFRAERKKGHLSRVTRKQWEQLNQPKEMWAEDMNLQSKTTMKEEAIKIGKDVHFQTKEYNKKRQTILQPSDRQKWKDWTRPGAGEWGNCSLSPVHGSSSWQGLCPFAQQHLHVFETDMFPDTAISPAYAVLEKVTPVPPNVLILQDRL